MYANFIDVLTCLYLSLYILYIFIKNKILNNWETLVSKLVDLRVHQMVTKMVIRSQKLFRVKLAIRIQERNQRGALAFQRIYRGFRGRLRYQIVYEAKNRMKIAAAIFVQRNKRRKKFWRDMKHRAVDSKLLVEKQYLMSIRLQRWWCGMRIRLKFLRIMEENKRQREAATKIQALFRGYIFR
jgi:hypothetical protein